MGTQSSTIVQRVWNYCNVLRDDGISYNLPAPDILAAEIVEDLRAALAQFEGIEEDLEEEK